MVTRLFSRTPLHEHAEASQRVVGVAHLSPESAELAALLAADPAPEVRSAAAERCRNTAALAHACANEADEGIRATAIASLGTALAESADASAARAFLESAACPNAARAAVARQAADAERRLAAIAALRDEPVLIDLAVSAGHAETRLAAAECVRTPEGLEALAEAAKGKDRGVARLAKQRLEALKNREGQASEADAILEQLEALAATPGPILTAVVELNRRWQALDMAQDADRLERCDAARRALQARFEREQAEQLSRTKFEKRVQAWVDTLAPPDGPDGLAALAAQRDALRDEAAAMGDPSVLPKLEAASARLADWERELAAFAAAEALVVEAEQLAADTSVDNAQLPERWQALDRAIRTPALTRRFEAALVVVEQRRLAQVQSAQLEAAAARNRIHALLHAAEEALAGGHVHAARAAVEEMKPLKAAAPNLPKPTLQRMGRVGQQLGELERWESFGQNTARVQLCEQAEALSALAGEPAKVAAEVKKLREAWKALDLQHAGVPKSLWERFDGACERAYAPAAQHFAQQAAQRKLARKQRDDFIAAAQAHVPTLLTEPPDWRAAEKWLRETERQWREGDLGSVDPASWKKLDGRLKEALAPIREGLAASRDQAKAGRLALIAEVQALAPKAMDRDVPSLVKAIQARWQQEAKANPVAHRDERALWEQFRAACDAIFEARNAKRKEEDSRKQEGRKALDEICVALEQLARATDKGEKELRAGQRELQDRWRAATRTPDPSARAAEGRFRSALKSVDNAIAGLARSREAAVWKALAAKDGLCEALESAIAAGGTADPEKSREEWAALPEMPAAWEKKLAARRDAALKALADPGAGDHRARLERGAAAKRDGLLDLEMALGIDSPPELKQARLALQVKLLKERFGGAAVNDPASRSERLVDWCAQPGMLEGRDRERRDRIFAGMAAAR